MKNCYPYKELVKLYVDRKISVNVEGLEKAGLIERFLNDVEKLSPTRPLFFVNDHHLEYYMFRFNERNAKYFSLRYSKEEETTYPVLSAKHDYEIGHLKIDTKRIAKAK